MKLRYFGYYPDKKNSSAEGGGIHSTFELLFIESGQACLEWLGLSYILTGPALFLLAPHVPHRLIQPSADLRYGYWELELQEEERVLPLQDLIRWNERQSTAFSDLPYVQPLFQMLTLSLKLAETYEGRSVLDELLIHDALKALLFVRDLLVGENEVEEQRPEGEAIGSSSLSGKATVEAAKRYLESTYGESIQLASLARQVHVHPVYLIRLFQREQGCTPFQYLSRLRMHAAVSYLANSELSIQKISQLCGYQSIHYFSRIFKKIHGFSPTEWRQHQH